MRVTSLGKPAGLFSVGYCAGFAGAVRDAV